MGSLALRPGDSLTILLDGFVNRLQDFQFPSFLLFKLRGFELLPRWDFHPLFMPAFAGRTLFVPNPQDVPPFEPATRSKALFALPERIGCASAPFVPSIRRWSVRFGWTNGKDHISSAFEARRSPAAVYTGAIDSQID